jgi:hypothetical protein
MKTSKFFEPNRFVRTVMALSLGFAGMLLSASLLFAKAVELGPEADGVWTCDKIVVTEKPRLEITSTRMGTLELRGRTYRTASKNDPIDSANFSPFSTDGVGGIKWSDSFAFVSYMGAIQKSTYNRVGDKSPVIEIEYSDNHAAGRMVCRKTEK